MSKSFSIITLILIPFITSCGLFKKNVSQIEIKPVENIDTIKSEVSLLIDSVNEQLFPFQNLQAGFEGNYSDQSSNIPLKGVFRLKHNEFIWISIRPAMAIEVSRILITPDSIKIIDRLNSQYYSEGYDYFYSKFKIICDFNTIESLFTGRIFYFPPGNTQENYQRKTTDSLHEIKIYSFRNNQNSDIRHEMIFDQNSLLMKQNSIQFPGNNQIMAFLYSLYLPADGRNFFSSLKVSGVNQGQRLALDCVLSDFVFNEDITAPFKIPESYKRIKTY
jgi:hypothetical protein